jgi:uncharacterized protein (TIGR03437 family)
MLPIRRSLALLVALAAVAVPGSAAEADALAISANIVARHLPFGTILDPIYAGPDSEQIVGYTRCGDSALWTGAWLAAEAFRYNVTRSPDALANVRTAVAGLKALADVTADNLLARCMAPEDSPYAQGIASEEAANGIYHAPPWIWVGNTSRDQYVGAIFGLGAAYDLVDDAAVKASISDLVTRLVRFLTGHNWSVVMPDGSSSTTFLVRPDEILALLQVGRHVNPDQFSFYYDTQRILLSATVAAPIAVDIASDSSYFKFNLDYMSFYNLVRLESSFAGNIYLGAYKLVRGHTASHQNAFFDIVDRALQGADATRDAEMRTLLDQWLARPRRDFYVDVSKQVAVCGSQACQPVPVPLRPPASFLWESNPFLLTGGGSGVIENSGIDYILPYWMGRYYGVIPAITVQPAAAAGSVVAPGSLASVYGTALASTTAQADSQPPPATLGNVTLTVTDAAGVQREAPLLYVSPHQINFVVPEGTAPGTATLTISNGSASDGSGTMTAAVAVQSVAPALFSADGSGSGVAAATAIRYRAPNPQLQFPVDVFQCTPSAAGPGCEPVPIDVGLDMPVILSLYGTGIRGRSALANVSVTIGGVSVPVLYAGPQPEYAGLDQINAELPLSLRGAGVVNVVVTVDGQSSNAVTIDIQ